MDGQKPDVIIIDSCIYRPKQSKQRCMTAMAPIGTSVACSGGIRSCSILSNNHPACDSGCLPASIPQDPATQGPVLRIAAWPSFHTFQAVKPACCLNRISITCHNQASRPLSKWEPFLRNLGSVILHPQSGTRRGGNCHWFLHMFSAFISSFIR
jgi:hypothetical protein